MTTVLFSGNFLECEWSPTTNFSETQTRRVFLWGITYSVLLYFGTSLLSRPTTRFLANGDSLSSFLPDPDASTPRRVHDNVATATKLIELAATECF